MSKLFFLLSLLVCLSACAPDPRNAADANRTAALTRQEVMDRTMVRDQTARIQALQLEERQATQADRIRALRLLYLSGAVAMSLLTVALAIIGIYGAGRSARAYGQRLETRSRLIYLDPQTRSYPLIPQYDHKGIYLLADPNTGGVISLDTRQPADQQLIRAYLSGQLAQIVAGAASKSNNSADIVTLGKGNI